jgi:HPt (histidine-containing phosphotransfer) domain-containing protein
MASRRAMAEGQRGPTAEELQLLDPGGRFQARLAADRRRLAALSRDLWRQSPPVRQNRLEEIETLAHRLAGAAGTFGFVAVGEAALALEDVLIEQREGLLRGERAALAARLVVLTEALDQATAPPPNPPDKRNSA